MQWRWLLKRDFSAWLFTGYHLCLLRFVMLGFWRHMATLNGEEKCTILHPASTVSWRVRATLKPTHFSHLKWSNPTPEGQFPCGVLLRWSTQKHPTRYWLPKCMGRAPCLTSTAVEGTTAEKSANLKAYWC
uniref:Uncharacterized protein n=1 Tax=Eutreptiella gymnastica TaxID=73025 RepID=A0A7S4G205_9EUGL